MSDANTSPLRRSVDALGEVFFAFTPEGEMLDWNQPLSEVTGYASREIKEMHPVDFVPGEEEDRIQSHIQRVLEEGQVRVESCFQTKQGREIPFEFTGLLIEQEEQALICGIGRNITERKRAREELEASEKRYRRLFREALEGIAITTPAGDILSSNPAAREIFEYSEEELLDIKTGDLYADPEKREDVLRELHREGTISQREVRFQRADGKEIVCELSATVLYGEDDEPDANLIFFRDVTDRARAEEALRESEEKFRKLSENALVGISLVQHGVYEYVNPALSEITGYSRAELIGKSPEVIVHPEEWASVRKQFERRLEEETEVVHYETRVRTKSGETRHVKVSGTRVTYQGEPALISTAQDVTEEKRAKEALEKSERWFRSLAEEAPVGIALQGEGGYQYANSTFEDICDCERKEILGHFPKDLYHPEDWPDVQRWAEEVLSGKRDSVHGQVRTSTKEGPRHVKIYAGRVTFQEEPALVWGVVDITDRIEMQKELLEVQEEERRRIGQDLHDSVASQLTAANLMLENLSSKVQTEDAAESIHKIEKIIEESAGEMRMLSHGLNPGGLSEGDLSGALEGLADNTEGARLETSLEGEKKEFSFASNDEAPTHLYRIAQEAVTNAWRHGEADEIVIRLAEKNGALLLEVEDDGMGFESGEVEKESSLGLRSMRHQAELLGAEFDIESSSGEGALVHCRLPL